MSYTRSGTTQCQCVSTASRGLTQSRLIPASNKMHYSCSLPCTNMCKVRMQGAHHLPKMLTGFDKDAAVFEANGNDAIGTPARSIKSQSSFPQQWPACQLASGLCKLLPA